LTVYHSPFTIIHSQLFGASRPPQHKTHFCDSHSSLTIEHCPLTIDRLSFIIHHSPFPIPHSQLSIPHSPFTIILAFPRLHSQPFSSHQPNCAPKHHRLHQPKVGGVGVLRASPSASVLRRKSTAATLPPKAGGTTTPA
jgi:hypothetical protein